MMWLAAGHQVRMPCCSVVPGNAVSMRHVLAANGRHEGAIWCPYSPSTTMLSGMPAQATNQLHAARDAGVEGLQAHQVDRCTSANSGSVLALQAASVKLHSEHCAPLCSLVAIECRSLVTALISHQYVWRP